MMRYPVLQLVFVVMFSYSLSSSMARKLSRGGAVSYCMRTTYPGICTSAMKEFGGARRADSNAEAVLVMHLGAIDRRSESASRTAENLIRNANPGMQAALKHCMALYGSKGDMIGVSMRELNTKDEQTNQVVRVMLQMIRESVQQCDIQFLQSRMSNPLAGFNRSIFMLAINADDLTNMMP